MLFSSFGYTKQPHTTMPLPSLYIFSHGMILIQYYNDEILLVLIPKLPIRTIEGIRPTIRDYPSVGPSAIGSFYKEGCANGKGGDDPVCIFDGCEVQHILVLGQLT